MITSFVGKSYEGSLLPCSVYTCHFKQYVVCS